MLSKQYHGGGWHPTFGLQEGRGTGVNERKVDVLPKERAGESGGERGTARRGWSGATESGVRATLGEKSRSNETGWDEIPKVGGAEIVQMDVVGVYERHEVDYGGPTVCLQNAGRCDRLFVLASIRCGERSGACRGGGEERQLEKLVPEL